jgi:opacity protein-like surface antigen
MRDPMQFRNTLPALLLLAATAQAADNGFYVGAGVGRSKFDLQSALKSTDTGFKLTAGLRVLDSFGVEASLADHGNASLPSGVACVALVGTNCPDVTRVSSRTAAAFAVGFLPFPTMDLFAKVGVGYADGKLHTPGIPAFGRSDSKTDLAWGFGAQAHFGSLAARGEYEQFQFIAGRKVGTVSASLLYTFL